MPNDKSLALLFQPQLFICLGDKSVFCKHGNEIAQYVFFVSGSFVEQVSLGHTYVGAWTTTPILFIAK